MVTALGDSRRQTFRQPNLIDVAILIAATAVGLAFFRLFLPTGYSPSPYDQRFKYLTPPAALSWVIVCQPLLMAWSAAWLVLQLRQPRPRLRRLALLTGFRACLAATMLVFISGPWLWVLLSSHQVTPQTSFLAFMSWNESLAIQIGVGVIVAWAPSLLGRRRCGRVGWLERGGRLLGAIWIVLIPANLLRHVWYLLGI